MDYLELVLIKSLVRSDWFEAGVYEMYDFNFSGLHFILCWYGFVEWSDALQWSSIRNGILCTSSLRFSLGASG